MCLHRCWMLCWSTSLVLAQTLAATLLDPFWYMHTELMLRYMTFYCTRADSWCNVKRSYKIFFPTSGDAWCYVTRSSLALAQTLGATLIDLLLFLHRHLRLLYKIFSCTCTLAQTLGLGATLQDLPSYLHRHLMLRYRVLGYRGGGTTIRGVARG